MNPGQLFIRKPGLVGVRGEIPTEHSRFLGAALEAGILAELHIEKSGHIRPVETPAFISYPQEWPLSQWKDALTSFLALEALANDAGLTHAAINISEFQFSGGKVRAWAYPALESLKDQEADQRWNTFVGSLKELLGPTTPLYSEGDIINKLLTSKAGPLSEKLWRAELVSPTLIKAIRTIENLERPIDLIHQLFGLISELPDRTRAAENKATHNDAVAKDLFSQRQVLLDRFFSKRKFGTLFDLNAGRGAFSRLIEPYGKTVVALDTEHDQVDENYRLSRYEGVQRSQVIPLISDIVNPVALDRPEALPIHERVTPDFALVLSVDQIAPSVDSLARLIRRLAKMRCEVLLETGLLTRSAPVHDPLPARVGADYSQSTFEHLICEAFRIKETFSIDAGTSQFYRITLK